MVEVEHGAGRDLLLRLLAEHPEWESELEAGSPSNDSNRDFHPKLHIPSAHPTIQTPLTIELGGTLQLFWNGSYFYDFIQGDIAAEAFDFLQRFFAEEIRCGLSWRQGTIVGGGPVEEDGFPRWNAEYDRIEVRSWRGNRDEIAEKNPNAVDP